MAVCKVPLSCEFFPTATPEGAEKLAAVRRELAYLQCEYYSVTYGAGGSTRDRTMNELAQRYPQYGFAQNKGYGSRAHIAAIEQYGLTPFHRASYKIKSLQPSLFD